MTQQLSSQHGTRKGLKRYPSTLPTYSRSAGLLSDTFSGSHQALDGQCLGIGMSCSPTNHQICTSIDKYCCNFHRACANSSWQSNQRKGLESRGCKLRHMSREIHKWKTRPWNIVAWAGRCNGVAWNVCSAAGDSSQWHQKHLFSSCWTVQRLLFSNRPLSAIFSATERISERSNTSRPFTFGEAL